MRLIDADGLGVGKAKREVFDVPEFADGWNSAIDAIDNAPTIEAEPVRHGEWLPYPSDQYRKCSVCGIEYAKFEMLLKHKYCPSCGAKMDGGEKE